MDKCKPSCPHQSHCETCIFSQDRAGRLTVPLACEIVEAELDIPAASAELLAWLTEHQPASREVIAQALGCSLSAVSNRLTWLKRADLIQTIDIRHGAKYVTRKPDSQLTEV